MSILSSIINKIFPTATANASVPPSRANASNEPMSSAATATTTSQAATPGSVAVPMAPPEVSQTQSSALENTAQISEVDVEKILSDRAQKSGQPSNWRTSIVDLLKLLDLDNSLQSRKELAEELHYTGDTSDSASMNIWLHKQVMNKLAANGGKVPDDLRE